MKSRSRGTVVRSVLFAQRWRVLDAAVRVMRLTTAEISVVERAWTPHRPASIAHWNWLQIAREHADHFAVLRDDDVVALWAGSPDALGRPPTYPLHFLEVAPAARGQGVWGGLALDLVCQRAAELAAQRVVLHALPERVAWYRRWGATDGASGWNPEPGLALMSIEGQVLRVAVERLDGIREEEEDEA